MLTDNDFVLSRWGFFFNLFVFFFNYSLFDMSSVRFIRMSEHIFVTFAFLDLQLIKLFLDALLLWKICIALFISLKKIMTGMFFSSFLFFFLPHWSVWLLHSVAPAEATGAGMRSEREQLIKSSSSHNAESQFCSPSTVISFYLRVMSYGIFALGNTMSSINVFHLLHKQGQVIPASFYLHNQSNCLRCWEREQGEQKRQNIWKYSKQCFFFFLWITAQ